MAAQVLDLDDTYLMFMHQLYSQQDCTSSQLINGNKRALQNELTIFNCSIGPTYSIWKFAPRLWDNVSIWNTLKHLQEWLQTYYHTHNVPEPSSETDATQSATFVASGSFHQVNFIAQYKKWAWLLGDEIDKLFKLPKGAFDNLTLFSGGKGGMHNSQIILASHKIFFPSQVCINPLLFTELLTCYTPNILWQIALSLLNRFSLVDEIQSRCTTPVCCWIQFAP